MRLLRMVPQFPQVDLLWPKSCRKQLEHAELNARAVERLENRAEGVWFGLVREGHDREVVVVYSLDPRLFDTVERVLKGDALVIRERSGDLSRPGPELAGATLQNIQGQYQFF